LERKRHYPFYRGVSLVSFLVNVVDTLFNDADAAPEGTEEGVQAELWITLTDESLESISVSLLRWEPDKTKPVRVAEPYVLRLDDV